MSRLTNFISLVSLVSLASIARCRPILDGGSVESFSLMNGPLLPDFSPNSAALEIPSELSAASFETTNLNIPVGSSGGYFPFASTDFDIASGPMCGNPNLASACCSSLFNAGGCEWGVNCLAEQINLCCARISEITPGNCEPPKTPSPSPPPPPRLSESNDNIFDEGINAITDQGFLFTDS